MKARTVPYAICITGSLLAGPFVNNPRAVAQEQATTAFKTTGVTTRGIVSNVNELQDAVGRIKKGVDEVQRAVYAPRSPFSRLNRIVNNLKQFKKRQTELQQSISASDLEKLLRSETGPDEILKKISDARQKIMVRAFYDFYDALLFEMDMVVIHAVLHHMRQTLYEVAGMLDTIAHMRDYAGIFSDDVLTIALVQDMRSVAGAIRAFARKLNEIMQGGTRSMKADRAAFAADLIAHSEKIGATISALLESSSAITATVPTIQFDLVSMTKMKNSLIRAATLMQKRLAQALIKAHKGTAGQDLPSVAQAEIKTMIQGLHEPTIALLWTTTDLLQKVIHSMRSALDGINVFKTYIGFDVVNPVVRLDLDALPDLMRELSRTITQLRGALG